MGHLVLVSVPGTDTSPLIVINKGNDKDDITPGNTRDFDYFHIRHSKLPNKIKYQIDFILFKNYIIDTIIHIENAISINPFFKIIYIYIK